MYYLGIKVELHETFIPQHTGHAATCRHTLFETRNGLAQIICTCFSHSLNMIILIVTFLQPFCHYLTFDFASNFSFSLTLPIFGRAYWWLSLGSEWGCRYRCSLWSLRHVVSSSHQPRRLRSTAAVLAPSSGAEAAWLPSLQALDCCSPLCTAHGWR